MHAESRIEKPLPIYVPRDEQFEESKQDAFSAGRLQGVLRNLIPLLKASISVIIVILVAFRILDKDGDKFAWLRDDEFARQALAGVNPVTIEGLQAFPPVSNLDPEIYGPQESALKEEHIIGQLDGMSVQQALKENKLYVLDCHHIYLPFLDKINALDAQPPTVWTRSKRVLKPPVDATSNWLWQLARAHVCSNDARVRTHACMEPFILTAHRQLSAMHPIYKLLDPHMRYTLEINALARKNLINADGEGLPADLIRRGIAVPDPTQPDGLKLLIEDYPFAADGLLIWSAIEDWVPTYLKSWYNESINVGHADLRHESWWPTLTVGDDLVSILNKIIWLASAEHAALNFGQCPYGGYVPNRPPFDEKWVMFGYT
ncbi:hypothetical protein CUMW_036700, partial [Citrus unshiu]